MRTLKPEGDEPFNLPLAQQVQTFGGGDVVTLSFSVSFTGGPLQKVRIEMTKDKAIGGLGRREGGPAQEAEARCRVGWVCPRSAADAPYGDPRRA
jgi:hypothetical protein